MFSMSDPNSSKHKYQFYKQLCNRSSQKPIFGDSPYPQEHAQNDSHQIDRKQEILPIYCNKKVIVHLFDKTHAKHYSQKRKNLIRSPTPYRHKRSKKFLSRNNSNHILRKQSEIDSQQSAYPINKQQQISHTLTLIFQSIIGYFMQQTITKRWWDDKKYFYQRKRKCSHTSIIMSSYRREKPSQKDKYKQSMETAKIIR